MESSCLTFWQRAPSPRVLASGASAKTRFLLTTNANLSSDGTHSTAHIRRCGEHGRTAEKIRHSYPFFSSSRITPSRRTSVLKQRCKKSFSVPRDAQFEEAAEVQDLDDELSGVVGTESKDEEVRHVEVDASTGGILKRFPKRYMLIFTTSLAFVICNMDKVNMSVAIIPMSHQLGWSASTSGLVQSSFFWGYAVSQLPGGFLAGRFSGKRVLRAGVLIWSIATALVPLTSPFLPGLLLCRLMVGLGEGVSPAAATDLIARTMPVFERSRAVSFVFGGLSVGSVLGLLLAPAIIKLFGWEVVFYMFGLLGILWCLAFDTSPIDEGGNGAAISVNQSTSTGNQVSSQDNGRTLKSVAESDTSDSHASSFDISDKAIPWKSFFKDPAVWAMMYAHFCGNWGHYNLLSWFPSYFSDELNLDLTNSALVSILPPLGSVVVAAVASSLADYLIAKGVDCTFVRKLCQSIAFVSPAVCMTVISLRPDLSPWLTASLLTVGSSLSTFTLAGLYCTHQDISPQYASVLLYCSILLYRTGWLHGGQNGFNEDLPLTSVGGAFDTTGFWPRATEGLTNTVGAVPGIVGVALTGYVLDQTKSWTLALFAPSIFFYVTGAVVWNVFASSKPKTF